MSIPFARIPRQYDGLVEDLQGDLRGLLETGAFAHGPPTRSFEAAWAEYLGVAHARAFQSGTAALLAAFEALELGPGDEVITAANTFVATVGAIHFAGATPVLVDCQPGTFNMCPEDLARKVTPQTRAVVPVHLYGHAADMDPILEVARAHGLKVVEDASQAHGATYEGRMVGTLGDVGCFSFYPGKNLGAAGEGGAAVTADEELATRLAEVRNHGGVQRYQHRVPGLNLRMDSIQGAVLGRKLARLDEWNAARRERADRYTEALAGSGVEVPTTAPWAGHVWHLYVVRAPRRDALQAYLGERDIASGIHYPAPVHLLEAYRHLGYQEGDFPVAERAAGEILSLPMFPELTLEEVDQVAAAVREFHQEETA
jgi:dTDP-4-amino-4,6-dideoxygalactose transaminase